SGSATAAGSVLFGAFLQRMDSFVIGFLVFGLSSLACLAVVLWTRPAEIQAALARPGLLGALNISSTINAVERLGTPLTVIDGYQIIDATKIEVTPWNVPEFHSYYATKTKVITDMIAVLKGETPEERALVPHLTAAGTFWSIGD
ncbi:MAG TPA: hypothetical protein PLG99_07190, partial [Kaistiaceae bacterium]|nr:hypothetical protein [Kaistiaceae bacterium]